MLRRVRGNRLRSNPIVGGGPTSLYLGHVARRIGFVPNTLTASQKQMMSRSAHFASDAISSLKVVLYNFYVDGTGVEVGSGATASFTASVEYPAGTFTRILFGGNVTGTAPSASLLTSDDTSVSIPNGAQFWIKVWRADANGIVYVGGQTYLKSTALLGDAFNFSGTTVPDTTMNTTATNLDANNQYFPAAVVAMTRKGSIHIIGDSITAAAYDTLDATGNIGPFGRWVNHAYVSCGRSGDRADWAATGSNSALRRSLGQYASDVIIQYQVNDLLAGRSAAQVQADLVTLGNLFKAAYPSVRTWLPTAIPMTNAANTVPNSANPARVTVNDWKRTSPAPYNGFIEIANTIENGVNGGLFANVTYTTDGIHGTQACYVAVAAAGLNSAIFDRV